MAKLKTILFYYNLCFVFILLTISLVTKAIFTSPQLLIIFFPLIIYFWGYLIINSSAKIKTSIGNQFFWLIVSLLLIFNFLSTLILSALNLFFSKSLAQIIISLLYLPFPLYFFLTILHWYQKLKPVKPETIPETGKAITVNSVRIDHDRRRFLKLVGGTSLSLVFLSLLNPKQAGAAFFGSVPGPGTVGIKDTAGNKINPAEKQPTDGYKISKIDDTTSNTYSYYGFVNQDGEWYIQQETTSGVNAGTFLYYKGSSDFSINWEDRGDFIYDDFEDIVW